jgi:hypothetical protein
MNVLGKVRRVTANYCVAMIVSIGSCLAPQPLWAYPFAYITPACPLAGEPVTLYITAGTALVPVSISQQGNTIYVFAAYSSFNPQGQTYGVGPLGSFPTGAYQVVINGGTGNGGVTIDIAVGASPANVAGAWYNPSAPGYGFAIYQGDKSISGSYYTYRGDSTPTWYLLQSGNCTPSGFAGILNSYRGSSGGNASSVTAVGAWRFDPGGPNQATFTESFSDVFPAPPPVTRPLTRVQFP